MNLTNNLTIVKSKINYLDRVKNNNHKGYVFWLTGISGAGKSTIAINLEEKLFKNKYQICVLDGDNTRTTVNSDLSFSAEDRYENNRRIAHMANQIKDLGFIVIVATICPYENIRQMVREIISQDCNFIYVKSSIENCKKNDFKNLYKKAEQNIIKNFTSVSDKYEPPHNPELVLESDKYSMEQCTTKVYDFILDKTKLK